MTRMNYETMKRRQFRSDFVGDDLPRTGSRADQARYAAKSSDRLGCYHVHRNAQGPSSETRGTLSLSRLRAFVAHAEAPDFARKYPFERADLLSAIQKLTSRVRGTGYEIGDAALIKRADALLRRFGC